MIESIKERLSQLVEINRALAHDLDVSRRVAAEVGRERDTLLRELDALSTDAEAARARAARAEGESESLAGRLRRAERERDDAVYQLAESVDAMEEIRGFLSGLRGGVADLGRLQHQL